MYNKVLCKKFIELYFFMFTMKSEYDRILIGYEWMLIYLKIDGFFLYMVKRAIQHTMVSYAYEVFK